MDSDKLWHTYNSFRLRKTRQFMPAIYKALQGQIKYYIDTNDLVNLPTQEMYDAIHSLHIETGRIWAANTYYNILKDAGIKKFIKPEVNIKRNGAIGLNEDFVQAIIDFFNTDLFNTITNITETTRKFIKDTVANGIQNQLSLDDIINNLLSSVDSKTRAALIARTETMKAANAAEQIGVDKTGLKTTKIWISVRDKRTRHDHITADNQVQPDGKPFIVGNEAFQMQRPGANKSDDGRRIPAKEVCNCRCTVGRKVLRGANGLPLRKAD